MLVGVEVSAADVERVPAENLRVSRAEVAAVWRAAEQLGGERPADWYIAGVVMTCEWLARATVRPASGQWYVARSPVTERQVYAMPETIEAEYLATAKLAMRQPAPSGTSCPSPAPAPSTTPRPAQ